MAFSTGPRFSGKDLNAWISSVERTLFICQIHSNYHVQYAMQLLDGAALTWARPRELIFLNRDWNYFVYCLREEFEKPYNEYFDEFLCSEESYVYESMADTAQFVQRSWSGTWGVDKVPTDFPDFHRSSEYDASPTQSTSSHSVPSALEEEKVWESNLVPAEIHQVYEKSDEVQPVFVADTRVFCNDEVILVADKEDRALMKDILATLSVMQTLCEEIKTSCEEIKSSLGRASNILSHKSAETVEPEGNAGMKGSGEVEVEQTIEMPITEPIQDVSTITNNFSSDVTDVDTQMAIAAEEYLAHGIEMTLNFNVESDDVNLKECQSILPVLAERPLLYSKLKGSGPIPCIPGYNPPSKTHSCLQYVWWPGLLLQGMFRLLLSSRNMEAVLTYIIIQGIELFDPGINGAVYERGKAYYPPIFGVFIIADSDICQVGDVRYRVGFFNHSDPISDSVFAIGYSPRKRVMLAGRQLFVIWDLVMRGNVEYHVFDPGVLVRLLLVMENKCLATAVVVLQVLLYAYALVGSRTDSGQARGNVCVELFLKVSLLLEQNFFFEYYDFSQIASTLVGSSTWYFGANAGSFTHNRGKQVCTHGLPAVVCGYSKDYSKHTGCNILIWDPGRDTLHVLLPNITNDYRSIAYGVRFGVILIYEWSTKYPRSKSTYNSALVSISVFIAEICLETSLAIDARPMQKINSSSYYLLRADIPHSITVLCMRVVTGGFFILPCYSKAVLYALCGESVESSQPFKAASVSSSKGILCTGIVLYTSIQYRQLEEYNTEFFKRCWRLFEWFLQIKIFCVVQVRKAHVIQGAIQDAAWDATSILGNFYTASMSRLHFLYCISGRHFFSLYKTSVLYKFPVANVKKNKQAVAEITVGRLPENTVLILTLWREVSIIFVVRSMKGRIKKVKGFLIIFVVLMDQFSYDFDAPYESTDKDGKVGTQAKSSHKCTYDMSTGSIKMLNVSVVTLGVSSGAANLATKSLHVSKGYHIYAQVFHFAGGRCLVFLPWTFVIVFDPGVTGIYVVNSTSEEQEFSSIVLIQLQVISTLFLGLTVHNVLLMSQPYVKTVSENFDDRHVSDQPEIPEQGSTIWFSECQALSNNGNHFPFGSDHAKQVFLRGVRVSSMRFLNGHLKQVYTLYGKQDPCIILQWFDLRFMETFVSNSLNSLRRNKRIILVLTQQEQFFGLLLRVVDVGSVDDKVEPFAPCTSTLGVSADAHTMLLYGNTLVLTYIQLLLVLARLVSDSDGTLVELLLHIAWTYTCMLFSHLP